MLRLLVIIVFCTLCIIPIAGFASNIISNEALLIAFTFGFGYVALPAMLLHLWPAPKDAARQSMEAALAAGNLLTRQHAVVRIAELEEFEDEGRLFLAEMTDGKTLCLAGPYLDSSVERKVFPSLEFRTFTNRMTGLIYGVEPTGPPLESWSVYGNFTESKGMLIDGQLYDNTIARLVSTLGGQALPAAYRVANAEQAVPADGDR